MQVTVPVEIEREVDVTREVPVTFEVEVTREVPVPFEIQVTREVAVEIPVTVEVPATVEVPIEVTREVTIVVEVTREVETIVEVTSVTTDPIDFTWVDYADAIGIWDADGDDFTTLGEICVNFVTQELTLEAHAFLMHVRDGFASEIEDREIHLFTQNFTNREFCDLYTEE